MASMQSIKLLPTLDFIHIFLFVIKAAVVLPLK